MVFVTQTFEMPLDTDTPQLGNGLLYRDEDLGINSGREITFKRSVVSYQDQAFVSGFTGGMAFKSSSSFRFGALMEGKSST